MSIDNLKIDLRVGDGMLEEAIVFAGRAHGSGTKPVGYRVTPEHGMILFWYIDSSDKTTEKFPCLLDPMDFILGWAKKARPEDFKSTDSWDALIDHDGDDEKAWRIYNEDWGHVAHEHGAYLAIKPVWGWLGK